MVREAERSGFIQVLGEELHGLVEGDFFDEDEEIDCVSEEVFGLPDPVMVFNDKVVELFHEEVVSGQRYEGISLFLEDRREGYFSGAFNVIF